MRRRPSIASSHSQSWFPIETGLGLRNSPDLTDLAVAALVRCTDDLPVFETLAADACDRVRSRVHDVHRDNEFFVKSARERRSKR